MTEIEKEALVRRINELALEHRDLDEVIERLSNGTDTDDLQIRRLKKWKLQLKDQITALEGRLTPDLRA
jgi:hypothetical protein